MIRLAKTSKPQVLADNEAAWTAEYAAWLAGDPNVPAAAATRYRDESIKAQLRIETGDKCAYCESKVSHVYPGACEHILPKSQRPELIVAWGNLTYVCFECNREKRDYYDPTTPLLNPYVDEPGEHLRFFGPLCLEVPTSERGRLTRQRLDLNRLALVQRRQERIERLQLMLATWASLPEGSAKEQYRIEIEHEAATDQEYTAVATSFLAGTPEW